MTLDARVTLARADLAASGLEGVMRADRFAEPVAWRIVAPSAALRAAPHASAEQVDQMLFGETFDALEMRDGFAWGQARRDGYIGWVETAALGPLGEAATHWVKAPRTVVFATASIKSAVWGQLSLNALVTVSEIDGAMARVSGAGWAPAAHLAPIGRECAEPAATAERFLGAPYVWGGRDGLGLDCSGLVQQAFYAAGLGCPRDTDQQAKLGYDIAPADLTRGDLVFWAGHVGMMLDAARLIHANAHHMAVAIEPLTEAMARIADKRVGRPTAFRRIDIQRANT